MQVTAKALQESHACREAAQAVLAGRPPQEFPEADPLITLLRGHGKTVWNRLEDALKPLRLYPA
jgi:hypothetical protein